MRVHGIVLISLFGILMQPALADHCTTYSTSATDFPNGEMIVVPIDTNVAFGVLYVVIDVCQFDGCMFSHWVYQESNGLPGLQRADPTATVACHDMVAPDAPVA